MSLAFVLALAALGFGAGVIGALLGLGGGIFLVPALTLGLGLPFGQAAGTSLVGVAATSAGGAGSYVRAGITNIRLAVLLAVATVAAAVGASYVAQLIDVRILRTLFAALLLYTAVSMLRESRPTTRPADAGSEELPPPPVEEWTIPGSYRDAKGRHLVYRIGRIPLGMAASLLGGTISGLLGVGGGLVQVPVMHLLMGVPLRVATGTSSYLIGITATASALIYYARSNINPLVAAPVALAVFAGARVGAYLGQRLPSRTIKRVFAVIALFMAVQMILQAGGACPWCPPTR
jgi:uncharacterized membrane protein YfcA